MNKKILIVAGEASGDLHGAALIDEMRKLNPEIEFVGIGGDKMITAGFESLYHIKDMAFLGFSEVIKHLPFIRKVRTALINKVKSEKIGTVILIDYPGFNLNLAKKLKAQGLKVIYYISPQVWAWGKGRVKKMKKFVDQMIVIFPFEEEFYKNAGINVKYVGHPIVNRIDKYEMMNKEEFFNKYNLDLSKEILLLLPGSRKQEIQKIFPEVIKGAEKIAEEFNMQIVIACANNIDDQVFSDFRHSNNFVIVKGFTYELFEYSKFGIIKSGTSTLEAGYFQLPFLVVYSTSAITYFIGKNLVNIENIAMANIIAGKTLVPELIQNEVNGDKIFDTASKYLKSENNYIEMKNSLSIIKEKLGKDKASKNAAELINNILNAA